MRVSLLLISEADPSLLDSIRYFQGCDAHIKAAGIPPPFPKLWIAFSGNNGTKKNVEHARHINMAPVRRH